MSMCSAFSYVVGWGCLLWPVHSLGKTLWVFALLHFVLSAAAAAKSLQSCLTLCDPTDDSPPGSPVPGILQARTLEWVAISFSSAWKWKETVKSLSRVRLLATPWTAAHQAPPSMGFSREEYWSGHDLATEQQQENKGEKCEFPIKISVLDSQIGE